MTIPSPFDRVFVILPTVLVALGLRWSPNIWFVVIPYHVMCVALPFVEGTHIKLIDLLRLIPAPRRQMAIAVFVVVLGGGLAYLDILSFLPSSFDSFIEGLFPWSAFVIYSVVVNPFAEEWFWRGFIVGRWGISKSALWFALVHFIALASLTSVILSAVMTLPIFAFAVYCGRLRRATGSLWPSIIVHLGIDAAILLAISGS